MINLMPPEIKQDYRYARRNVALRNWVVILLISLVGLGALTSYGMITIHQSTVSYKKQLAAGEVSFQKEKFSDIQKQAQDMTNSFKLVLKVLGKEVLFSQLIKQIAATMPDNTVLKGLSINQLQGGLDITAGASDYSSATQVQLNLADPKNKIFNKADIVSISCKVSETSDPDHPCTVIIRALFANNNPFLFINNQVKS